MSQQLALLRIYNGLARGELRQARQRVLAELGLGDTWIDEEIRADALEGRALEDLTTLAQLPADEERPVLAIEKLELLVAMAHVWSQIDGADRSFVDVNADQEEVRALVRSLISDEADHVEDATNALAEAIQVGAQEGKAGLVWLPDGEPPERIASELVLEEIDNREIVTVQELSLVAAVTCIGALIKVEVDGQGEYATFLETRTNFTPAHRLGVDDFWDSLLVPTNWTAHRFWCAMKQAENHQPELGQLGVALGDLQVGCPNSPGQHDWLIWEQVGFCQDPGLPDDLFPRTFLCFHRHDDRPAPGGPGRLFLTYRLLPVDRSALAIDDGVIEVRGEQAGGQVGMDVEVRITKSLYIRALGGKTEAHALAEFACQMGWADQTRSLIVQVVKPIVP